MSCVDCRHLEKGMNEYPCNECKHNFMDKFEAVKEITISDLIKHLQRITNQQGKIPLHITIENLLRRKI